jgi:hypothetical protein
VALAWVLLLPGESTVVAVAQVPAPGPALEQDQAQRESRLGWEQRAYGSRLQERDLEQARALRERYRQEWLGARARRAPPAGEGPEIPGRQPDPEGVRPWLAIPPRSPPGTAQDPESLRLRDTFDREQTDLSARHRQEDAEQARMHQRKGATGLAPGEVSRWRLQQQSERAEGDLSRQLLRPYP